MDAIVPYVLPLMSGKKLPSFMPALFAANPPDVYVNLKTNQAWIKQGSRTVPATSIISVSRATAATQVDASGFYAQFASNQLAWSNLGAAIWEARTNSIRNNTMQGAIIGNPGTLPNNWLTGVSGVGLSTQVVAIGVESGITYLDLRVFGTTTSPSTASAIVQMEAATAVAALYGQTWISSAFVTLIAGSIASLNNVYIETTARDGAGAFLQGGVSTFVPGASGNLGRSRFTNSLTLSPSNTAAITSELRMNVNSGVVVDFTLRIGWPQLENNSQITSSVASGAVAAGGSGGVDGTAIYLVGGGAGTTPAQVNVTVAGGAITAINSVAQAGSYTTFPPSPAALTYVSGTGSGVTGATANLTPTDKAAQAMASPPIVTTGAAATRNSENDALILTGLPAFGTAITVWGRMTPLAPAGYPINQYIISANDGTLNNRASIFRNNTTGGASYRYVAGGVAGVSTGLGSLTSNVSGKMIIAGATGDQVGYSNGGNQVTGAGAGAPASTLIGLGIGETGNTGYSNGNLEEFAVWFNQRIPNAQAQAFTA